MAESVADSLRNTVRDTIDRMTFGPQRRALSGAARKATRTSADAAADKAYRTQMIKRVNDEMRARAAKQTSKPAAKRKAARPRSKARR